MLDAAIGLVGTHCFAVEGGNEEVVRVNLEAGSGEIDVENGGGVKGKGDSNGSQRSPIFVPLSVGRGLVFNDALGAVAVEFVHLSFRHAT